MSNDDPDQHRRAGRSLAVEALPNVTVFRCLNCSRPATQSASAAGRHLSQPEPEWPLPVHEVVLPCTGRLQPEHLLKAFEAGADAVCVITCAQDDCHYLEGSRRAEKRVGYVRELLDEIGLGAQRLTLFQLAASEELGSGAAAICEMVMAGLGALQPNALRQGQAIV
jgi:coenzyme F420-reducing hydrogenase delta subunit